MNIIATIRKNGHVTEELVTYKGNTYKRIIGQYLTSWKMILPHANVNCSVSVMNELDQAYSKLYAVK